MKRLIKILSFIASVISIALISVVIALTAIIFIAFYTPEPVLFLSAGAFVFILCYFFGYKIIIRKINSISNKAILNILLTVGIFIFLSLAIVLISPIDDTQGSPNPAEDIKFWNLESGSRIAYKYIPSMGKAKPYPVIFLHGGPGVPDLIGDADYFGQLAEYGYDVYIYAQVGSGDSSRLKDPNLYTLKRDAEDLKLIRKEIDAEKIILIAHSYGAEVAAHYLASNQKEVENIVFISPGALDPSDKSGGNLTNHLTKKEKMDLLPELFQPRVLMAYVLLQVNPEAAHNFVGDDEMDARFDRVYSKTQSALHCGNNYLNPSLSNLGFYVNQTPQAIGASEIQDIRGKLNNIDTHALIIKGACDYLSWSSALEYLKPLINSEMVYLLKTGHNAYQDKPEEVMQIIRAFISNQPLPVSVYEGTEQPLDYGKWK